MSNSNSSSNKVNVPEAKEAMNKFKYEVANEIGISQAQVSRLEQGALAKVKGQIWIFFKFMQHFVVFNRIINRK